jgi:hypothetical protein
VLAAYPEGTHDAHSAAGGDPAERPDRLERRPRGRLRSPDWQQPRPDVAGLRTREEVERLRTYLMAGSRFRADPLAPRLLTDRGQRVVERFGFAEGALAVFRRLRTSGEGIAVMIIAV